MQCELRRVDVDRSAGDGVDQAIVAHLYAQRCIHARGGEGPPADIAAGL